MGKLKLFQINFAENRMVYYPGNLLTGQLSVQLAEAMEMRAIKLKFVGRAHVHWSESRGSGKNRRTVHYSATEKLFEQPLVVYGQGAPGTEDRDTLHQGSHTFPFSFQLPPNLPSSFEDHVGYIRYFVKATIDKPWKFDHTTKTAFTVLDMLDLNAQPNMMSVAGASDNKTLCCWCCSSGPIEVDFHTDRTGYVPGEWIIINGTVTNSSNSDVDGTSVELIQTVKYHATSKTKTLEKSVNKIKGQGCGPHGTITWSNERLHIPPIPPSESAHCRIIDIDYSVQFTVHLRTCAINLRPQARIVVGTIPLRSLGVYGDIAAAGMPEPPAPSLQPTALLMAPEPAMAVAKPESSRAPPPSYAAATGPAFSIKDDDDNDHTMGEMSYAPQYTYYDWSQSAFTYN